MTPRVTMRELRAEARRVYGDRLVEVYVATRPMYLGSIWLKHSFRPIYFEAPTRAAVMAGLYAALKTMRTKA